MNQDSPCSYLVMLPSPEYMLQDLGALSVAEERDLPVLFPVECDQSIFYADYHEKVFEASRVLSMHPKIGDPARIRRVQFVAVPQGASEEEIRLILNAQA